MRFLKKLFEKVEDPVPVFEDPKLGRMEWSSDDEAWTGTFNGFRFTLSYEGKAMPATRLLDYAKDMLSDPGRLAGTLEKEKNRWMSKVPPNVKDEVASLKFGNVHFSIHKDRGYTIADIEGGGGDRSWRIEYLDFECDGMDFDT